MTRAGGIGMTSTRVALDRIILDGITIHPRSAMLRMRPEDRSGLWRSPWWVHIASESLPNKLDASPAPIGFRGDTAGGREIVGDVQILGRRDGAYGTELMLLGLRPLTTAAASGVRS